MYRKEKSTFLFTNGNLALELDEFNQSVKRYIRGYGAAALEHYGIYHGIHRDEQLSTGWITGVSGRLKMPANMMPLGICWEIMRKCEIVFFMEGSNMILKQGSIICEPDTIIQLLEDLFRKIHIVEMD